MSNSKIGMMIDPKPPDFSRYAVPVLESADLRDSFVEYPTQSFIGSVDDDLPLPLYYYASLNTGPVLYVTFHGATRRGVDTYPRFDRVGSLGRAGVPFIAFSDPALGMDRELELAWYLGGGGWDPLENILAVIRSALAISGSRLVCLIGGSGGGFAALRAGHAIPALQS